MGDFRTTCPACGSNGDSIGIAFRDGEPCPYCGLPAETYYVVIQARQRGATDELIARAAEADRRAALAEAETERLRGVLDEIRRALD